MHLKLGMAIGLSLLLLTGCVPRNEEKSQNCQKAEIDLVGYTEKGKRLENCFVEYPGEPTRKDKSYYIVEDICGQFTNKFIEILLGKKIFRTEKGNTEKKFWCDYYGDKNKYLRISLVYEDKTETITYNHTLGTNKNLKIEWTEGQFSEIEKEKFFNKFETEIKNYK